MLLSFINLSVKKILEKYRAKVKSLQMLPLIEFKNKYHIGY